MTQILKETATPEKALCCGGSRRFGDLRGVQWRKDLGILPSSSSASIDDLRRVTANSRRRYAALRRQLLVDPHVPKDGSNSPDLVMDNPLSQNPDSMWGRFFKNAELERMVDQDLTRLYPERSSYFQTSECQGILRRILLLWCLRHPEYGYGQGMHELLAPLLYVLHVDVERFSEVRKVHEEHFSDEFDGFSFHENDLTYKFDFKKFSESEVNGNGFIKSSAKASSLGELEPEIQTIVLLTDAYGAEGELGVVISEKFMEHDTYSMFDALMSGPGGAVAMVEFFSPSPLVNSHTGLPPVIEASAAMYHLLSMVDSSLHSHLVELGVEPQYFALRWLRVLFGREFSLEDLLIIWDEIFACKNLSSKKADESIVKSNSGVLGSSRGAFVNAFAVSMILKLRSSLLATENATTCLQRLLNFSDDLNLEKLVEKAKSLQTLAEDVNNFNSLIVYPGLYNGCKLVTPIYHSLSLDPASPATPLSVVPESYWEEKWRVMHEEEEREKSPVEKQSPNHKNGWSDRLRRVRLSRTESDPSPSRKKERAKLSNPSVRRSLLADLERQLGFDEDKESRAHSEPASHEDPVEINNGLDVNDVSVSKTSSGAISEVNSSDLSHFSHSSSPVQDISEHETESESSFASNSSSLEDNDTRADETTSCRESSTIPVPYPSADLYPKCIQNEYSSGKPATGNERKPLSGKFQWLWKFGRKDGEGTSEKKIANEDTEACSGGNDEKNVVGFSTTTADYCHDSSQTFKEETVDQNLMVSLRNIGHSMLENIQVIESFFPQENRGQVGSLDNFSKNNGLVGKGQVTATAALKELRKISNLLSEM